MVIQYKCPNCGNDMAFDSGKGTLHCDSCGNDMRIEDMPKPELQEGESPIEDFEEFTPDEGYDRTYDETDGDAAQFQCQNCGAVLITNTDTSATTCSFCGAPVMLGERLSGVLAPSKVIPFSISRQQAEEAFRKWRGKGLLLPDDFKKGNRIKEVAGMYVPFWLYDLNGRGEAYASCTKVRHYTRGSYEYTETSYYDVYRKVDLNYDKIPADASKKMDDRMMDMLEPFDYNNLKDFNVPYLAGYMAEKYNYTDKDMFPRLRQRTEGYVTSYIKGTIVGYSTTTFTRKWIDVQQRHSDYTLMPVWMFCYDYKDGEHNFYMNGQTGKIVGKPPISTQKCFMWGGIFAGIIFIILKIIGLILGGGWV